MTTARRAKAAHERGDPHVERLSTGWIAPEWWWREELLKPVPRGRPRLRDNRHEHS
jgi:hypothetical protein